MSIICLLLYTIHLGGQEPEEYVIEMSLEEDLAELLDEKEQLDKDLAQNDPIKSHRAFNETAKPSIGEPEPLKTLDELIEERASEDGAKEILTGDGGYATNLAELREKRKQKKQTLGEREAQKEEFTNALKDKRTSISFSLVERNAYALPPPIYTCLEGGKVVVNIKVDASGSVTEADFNDKSSGTDNYCLVENAITYAKRARFSNSTKIQQIGTITYLFQGK